MTKAVTIYGIKNCDTIKKARAWLDQRKIANTLHDYRTDGLDRDLLLSWIREVGWQTLLNRASTTFRELPEKDKLALTEAKAITLMLAHLTLIKRPVLDLGGKLLVGFKAEQYETAFAK